jgi:hypothetical protein
MPDRDGEGEVEMESWSRTDWSVLAVRQDNREHPRAAMTSAKLNTSKSLRTDGRSLSLYTMAMA